jgi:hypothetical protein
MAKKAAMMALVNRHGMIGDGRRMPTPVPDVVTPKVRSLPPAGRRLMQLRRF